MSVKPWADKYGQNPHVLAAAADGTKMSIEMTQGEATIAPAGPPVADILAVAKQDLKPGQILDNIGGYTFYGVIDKAHTVREQKLLPAILAPGAKVIRAVKTGQPIKLDDVEVDDTSLLWKLHNEGSELV